MIGDPPLYPRGDLPWRRLLRLNGTSCSPTPALTSAQTLCDPVEQSCAAGNTRRRDVLGIAPHLPEPALTVLGGKALLRYAQLWRGHARRQFTASNALKPYHRPRAGFVTPAGQSDGNAPPAGQLGMVSPTLAVNGMYFGKVREWQAAPSAVCWAVVASISG